MLALSEMKGRSVGRLMSYQYSWRAGGHGGWAAVRSATLPLSRSLLFFRPVVTFKFFSIPSLTAMTIAWSKVPAPAGAPPCNPPLPHPLYSAEANISCLDGHRRFFLGTSLATGACHLIGPISSGKKSCGRLKEPACGLQPEGAARQHGDLDP